MFISKKGGIHIVVSDYHVQVNFIKKTIYVYKKIFLYITNIKVIQLLRKYFWKWNYYDLILTFLNLSKSYRICRVPPLQEQEVYQLWRCAQGDCGRDR